ncbi:signal peptidase I [Clostridium sp. 'White wine YQ']|uniref:signal peptidase I n=1 Tax=Clostridium sp. 'White wine YQ' TaxID=3027474 RepID=UPI00236525DF|nr:signal peptidase I [Clostridium sp. 'White wine YQ']MDD7792793.1 signal peptidase I [Clostridium sp. 'White wine YQ']
MKKKIFKYLSNIVIALLFILVIVAAYSNIQSKGKPGNLTSIGSYSWLSVLSGSMKPAFNPGDLIIDKKVDTTNLKVGDVITYMYGGNFLATHRITEVNKDPKGNLLFTTKGDSNNAKDDISISSSMIVGKYSFRIPLLGFLLLKIKGLPSVIGIWLLFFLVTGTEIYRIYKEQKKAKPSELKPE